MVKQVGGCRVDEIVGKSPAFLNADYLFKDEPCVAELKCLERDQVPAFVEKFRDLVHGWIREGIIPSPPPTQTMFSTNNLPHELQQEVAALYRGPFLEVLEKANKQIKQTKKHFDLEEAPGLLLLANDGNALLELEMVLYCLATAFKPDNTGKRRYSGITHVIYFTANLPSVGAIPSGSHMLWVSPLIDDDRRLSGFAERLREAWMIQHSGIIGERIIAFKGGVDMVDKIRIQRSR